MPIRPANRPLYGKSWPMIRAAILARAGNRCEGSPRYPDCRAENCKPHPVTGSRVVLTIAHMDHDPTHSDPANLRAWCQMCHLTYDCQHHAENARATRDRKRREAGQLAIDLNASPGCPAKSN